ncbi:MAG TPA: GAF domain-containing protein [Ktedonobacteraceae bacterium]
MESKRACGTWQEYLSVLIATPQEKQRLEREVRIQPITFQRWITGKSRPREENMRQLLRAIPMQHYIPFYQLLVQEFPGLKQESGSTANDFPTFSLEFYARTLSAHANTPPALFRQTLFDLILQQTIKQFDPHRQGMEISIVCCVPPRSGGKVRSLRQVNQVGTLPWTREDVFTTLFLGSESLAGGAVTHYRRQVVNSKNEPTFLPIHWTQHEESAAAFPICRQARIAGCLIVSSAHPYTFTNELQNQLECCASLLALAFEREDFFALEDIVLGPMPQYNEQERYFRDFGKRVSQAFVKAHQVGKEITIHEARQKVWQDIEEQMLHITLYSL